MFYELNERNDVRCILNLKNDKFTMNLSLVDFFPATKKDTMNLLKNNVLECENIKENINKILAFLENTKNDYSGFNSSYIAMNKMKDKYIKNIKYVNDFILKNNIKL